MIDRGIAEPAPAFRERSWGRQQLLAQLTQLLQHQPVAVLTGECGVGKFYLAEQYRQRQQITSADCLIVNALTPGQTSQLFSGVQTSESPLKRHSLVVLRHVDQLAPSEQQSLFNQLEDSLDGRRWLLTTRMHIGGSQALEHFQASLFYRIRMLACPIPALRDRKPCLPGLIRELVQEYAASYSRPIERIDESFTRAVERHDWPGNVRELRHAVERAVIECRSGILQAEHLPFDQTLTSQTALSATGTPTGALDDVVAQTERLRIEQALKEQNQSRTAAARELGISRVTLYNKMKKLGIG